MDNNNGDDLEYREERSGEPANKKIHIPLKLKSSRVSVKLTSGGIQKSKSFGSAASPSLEPPTTTAASQNDTDARKRPAARPHAVSTLNWTMNVGSSGQKILEQTMDLCMICQLPILIYGRLIPCKHVMCLQCANSIDIKVCLKEGCNERIERIERVVRGGIFVCLYKTDLRASSDLIRMNPDISQKKLCGRSYMSQRDLNSHIQHRHENNNTHLA